MRLSRVLLPAMFALASACASSQANDNELRAVAPKPKKNPNVITRDELQDPAITSRDALTAIRLLRPNFFTSTVPRPRTIPRLASRRSRRTMARCSP